MEPARTTPNPKDPRHEAGATKKLAELRRQRPAELPRPLRGPRSRQRRRCSLPQPVDLVGSAWKLTGLSNYTGSLPIDIYIYVYVYIYICIYLRLHTCNMTGRGTGNRS